MGSYTSQITIDELKSTDRSVLRTLTLVGAGLPAMGANWGLESVIPTTWYPGNPFEATQQVLVSKELPSHWTGEWRLTLLNQAPCSIRDNVAGSLDSVQGPGLLHDLFDDLQRKGQRLRVTWTVASDDPRVKRTIVREGRIKHFDAKYLRSMDIDWTCEWIWMSRGTKLQQKVIAAREEDVDSVAAAMIAAANAAIQAAAAATLVSIDPNVLNSASIDTLGQLESLASDTLALVQNVTQQLGRVVNQFTQLGDLALEFATLPFDIANTAVAFAQNTVAQGNQFLDNVGLLPFEVTATGNNVSDLTRSAKYFGQMGDAVAAANAQAMTTGGQIRDAGSKNPGGGSIGVSQTSSTTDGAIIAIYRVRAGDTPQSVSMAFYGNPDHAIDILRANYMAWYLVTLDPGTILMIPAITNKGP